MGFFAGSVDLTSPGPIGSTTPNTGAFTTLSANNGTLTASSPAFTLAQTWNSAGVTFTALRANITDTASASASLLMDLQVGGSSRFSVRKDGKIIVPSVNGLGIERGDGGGGGLLINGNATIVCENGQITFNGASLNKVGSVRWSTDAIIERDAAGVLAQRNSTNAQTFRLYNTYTDASNYERGFFRWSSNVLELGAEAAGTGTQRQLRFPLGTVTASTPLSITQTWNSSGVTFTGIQANITDTASASASLLMDLQVGGTSQFYVQKTGSINLNANSARVTIGTTVGSQVGILRSGGNLNLFVDSGTSVLTTDVLNIRLASTMIFGWNSTGIGSGSHDLQLARDASDILAQRRSTNAQTFRLYRTYTDASNYERLGLLTTNTTRYTITSQNAGTGSARSLEVSYYTSASDPTSTEITDGCFSVWKNSGTGTIKLWANDGGTMKSVALA